MTLAVVVSLVSWSALTAFALAGPADVGVADDEAVSETISETIGVVWHREATGPSAFRQRVVDAIAQPREPEAEPRVVVVSADQRARVVVALGLSRARADVVVRLAQGLTEATSRFREGDLRGADTAVTGVLSALEDDPLLLGVTALSFAALILRAQIAWTAGEAEHARAALARAVALDPEAELSTRRVPPELAALHAEVRREITGGSATWRRFTLQFEPDDGPVVVEIDGRSGQRAVPPGRHFVVVRRPGRSPLGFVAEAGDTLEIPEQTVHIASGLPADREAADAICALADVDRLVLAQRRQDRLALEGYICGKGFARVWFSEPYAPLGQPAGPPDAALAGGAALATGPSSNPKARSRLVAGTPWPKPKPPPVVADLRPANPPPPVPAKAWYRRAWIWSVIGGVVVAGVTTGAVLGTREQPAEIVVDADGFLRPQ